MASDYFIISIHFRFYFNRILYWISSKKKTFWLSSAKWKRPPYIISVLYLLYPSQVLHNPLGGWKVQQCTVCAPANEQPRGEQPNQPSVTALPGPKSLSSHSKCSWYIILQHKGRLLNSVYKENTNGHHDTTFLQAAGPVPYREL